MRTLRLILAVLVTGALVGGAVGAVTAESEESEAMAFPTGTFVSEENPDHVLEFYDDGTGLAFVVEDWEVRIRYGVSGDFWTEMTHEYPGSETDGSQTPATYSWDWDGEHLTFDLWGEDLRPHRNFIYGANTWRPVEDPVAVLVAKRDIPAGEPVLARWTTLGIVSVADAGDDALTYGPDVAGSLAVVRIAKGQPITPDLLEPAD